MKFFCFFLFTKRRSFLPFADPHDHPRRRQASRRPHPRPRHPHPPLFSDTISRATGAFKERGAANRLALLTETECRAGVIAMSAGNHAQAVARHASLLGTTAVIVMPQHTPSTKVTRTAGWGARVVLHGETLAEAAEHAHALAAAEGLVFIHPYDDPAVMAGQGTLALELLEDAPDLDMLVIPVGGGGLFASPSVQAAQLEVMFEARDPAHGSENVHSLEQIYTIRRI